MYQPRAIALRPLNPRRAALAGLLAASSLLLLTLANLSSARAAEAGAAKGKPVARSCQAAYDTAQQKEEAGQMVEAHRLYLSCSDTNCGTAVWHACVEANTHLRAVMPSIVPIALDTKGAPREDVEVKMDGQVIASQLTGVAILVDPGDHELSFSTGAGVFASTKLSIMEGERNRVISVSSPAAETGKQRLAATTRK